MIRWDVRKPPHMTAGERKKAALAAAQAVHELGSHRLDEARYMCDDCPVHLAFIVALVEQCERSNMTRWQRFMERVRR